MTPDELTSETTKTYKVCVRHYHGPLDGLS